MQRDIPGAPGKRIADLSHHEQIRRPGEHEATLGSLHLVIDSQLGAEQEIRDALHLVDDHPRVFADERAHVRLRLCTHERIVERIEGIVSEARRRSDEGGFPRLAYSGDDGDRQRGEESAQPTGRGPRQ
jgi:hypothetical protein